MNGLARWPTRTSLRILIVALTVLAAGCTGPVAGPVSFGLAVAEEGGTWCAAFDPAQPADRPRAMTLVSDGVASGPVVRSGVLGARRGGGCEVAFGQPGWNDHAVFDLAVSADDAASGWPDAALLVTSAAPWSAGPDGELRADIDYDGRPESLTICLADEGRHFKVWTTDDAARSGRRRLWHGYYDLGAAVDPTCGPGEDGRA
jgi:hypothetical protein